MNNNSRKARKTQIIVAAALVVLLLAFALAAALLLRGGDEGAPADGGAISAGGTTDAPPAASHAAQPAPQGALPETGDAGQAYVDETVFLGDSNIKNFLDDGLLRDDQVLAEPGIGIDSVLSYPYATLDGGANYLLVPDALAQLQPKRVLMVYGINDALLYSPEDFVQRYRAAVEAIQAAAPDTAIIVGGIPPIGPSAAYAEQLAKIPAMNAALLEMCGEMDIPYLDCWGALTDENGAIYSEYYGEDSFHLSQAGLSALLEYYRTHAYNP